jgi:hypothetical protein
MMLGWALVPERVTLVMSRKGPFSALYNVGWPEIAIGGRFLRKNGFGRRIDCVGSYR